MNNQHQTPKAKRHRNTAVVTAAAFFLASVLGLALLFFGGGRSASGNNMDGMPMATQAQAGTPVATNTVAIKGFAFSPATITVTAGSTVVWTNDDSVQHDITFDRGGVGSSVLNHNDTFSHTFATAGTYHYICSIHPFMHGTVVVTASGSTNANATHSSAVSGY